MENDKTKLCVNRLHSFEKKPNNFCELLKKYDKILIPKIQRDYAQGRDDPHAKEVRENFLNAILNARRVLSRFAMKETSTARPVAIYKQYINLSPN